MKPQAKRPASEGPPDTPTPTPVLSNQDSMQAMMDASVGGELLGVRKRILGREINPITLASIALLKQVKSPLIEGVPIESIQNVILECCIFMFLQTTPLREATALAFGDRIDLISASLEFANEIKPDDIQGTVTAIVDVLRDSTTTKVKTNPKKGEVPDSGNG